MPGHEYPHVENFKNAPENYKGEIDSNYFFGMPSWPEKNALLFFLDFSVRVVGETWSRKGRDFFVLASRANAFTLAPS